MPEKCPLSDGKCNAWLCKDHLKENYCPICDIDRMEGRKIFLRIEDEALRSRDYSANAAIFVTKTEEVALREYDAKRRGLIGKPVVPPNVPFTINEMPVIVKEE